MSWQFGSLINRPFQVLFFSMEWHLKEAARLAQEIRFNYSSNPKDWNLDLTNQARMAATASFIMGIAGIEAFTNNVLRDFAIWKKEDLPPNLLNHSQRNKDIQRWRLIDKVYFLSTLCNKNLIPPACFFQKSSKQFQLFEELVEIRNVIMHARPKHFLALIGLKPNGTHEWHKEFEENLWPISKIHKDLVSFNYDYAKIAHDNIVWIRDSLIKNIDRIDRSYMTDEKMELAIPIITDSELKADELIRHWRKYVSSNQQSRLLGS